MNTLLVRDEETFKIVSGVSDLLSSLVTRLEIAPALRVFVEDPTSTVDVNITSCAEPLCVKFVGEFPKLEFANPLQVEIINNRPLQVDFPLNKKGYPFDVRVQKS